MGGPRTRRHGAIEQVPSLKQFMHQTKVKNQYRGFLRAADRIDDEKWKHQVKQDIRKEFHRSLNETDRVVISMATKYGDKRLQELRAMVGYEDASAVDDPDSWINIKDEEDPRGRTGVEWPWERP